MKTLFHWTPAFAGVTNLNKCLLSMTEQKDDSTATVSNNYRRYAMGLLLVIYTLNFVDRQILNILAEPIRKELHLEDWQLGMMTGLAFAVFYTVLGIPLARLSDRQDDIGINRGRIISIALFVWSAFTALFGFTQTAWQMMWVRAGVGVGEAGCSPPAQALIADITPKEQRAKALAFYSLGVPVGSLLGMAIGGLIAQEYGWRMAFIVVGAPGMIVAVLSWFTLHDPRSNAVSRADVADNAPTMTQVLRQLLNTQSFWWLAFGAALISLTGYAHQGFFGSFFLRTHGQELEVLAHSFGFKGALAFVGVALGLLLGVAGGIGVYLGGKYADQYAVKTKAAYGMVPAIATLLSVPLFMVSFVIPSAAAALLMLCLPSILKNVWFGPVYAATQGIVDVRSRATATAILLLVINAIGLALGPPALGALSTLLSRSMGDAEGLKWAMVAITPINLLAAFCFWKACKPLEIEMTN
jgi:MFS family permease